MITIKERNGLSINNPDSNEKTIFLDTDNRVKTKDENGLIETLAVVDEDAPLVYLAKLTQSGTDAPVATVIKNTIGNIVWSYVNTGVYAATLTGAFPNFDKVVYDSEKTITGFGNIVLSWNSANVVRLLTRDSTDTAANDKLSGQWIKIEVYP